MANKDSCGAYEAIVCIAALSDPLLSDIGAGTLDVCEVMQHPGKYANTVVELKGVVYGGFEEFSFTGKDCENAPLAIWLAFAGEVEVKDDPELAAHDLKFVENKQSKQLERLLRKQCGSRVGATMRGFFQQRSTGSTTTPDGGTKLVGFGHMNMYAYRLIITSVERVEPLPCSQPER